MHGKIKYEFSANVWKHPAPSAWYFISLPQEISNEIREYFKGQEEGWGRLNVTAKIGSCQWETAIWFDTKYRTYLLPIKAEVRRKEMIEEHQRVDGTLEL
ncbi:MAG: DUF1905 domain-containing protein [Haliscomenobacter sp.]